MLPTTQENKQVAVARLMLLPRGSDNLCARMAENDLYAGPGSNPPVNDKQVLWVDQNMDQVKAMACLPDANEKEHRNRIAVEIARFFLLYAKDADRQSNDQTFKQETARRKVVADVFVDCLASYPLWAVKEGIREFCKTEDSKFPPKTPGEILSHVRTAYGVAWRTLGACQRVLKSNGAGFNVDKLRASMEGLEGKELAYRALDIMNILEKCCNIHTDPVGNSLHTKCYDLFHKWRKTNPLPQMDGADEHTPEGSQFGMGA